jgi:hypothetical protein
MQRKILLGVYFYFHGGGGFEVWALHKFARWFVGVKLNL